VRAKTKNDPATYRTRASLASSASKEESSTSRDRGSMERREANGVIDKRWYINFSPRRKSR